MLVACSCMSTCGGLSFWINFVSVCSQCVWPHQLQVRLGAGQSGLQAVLPPSVYWVGLRPLAAHRPAGNAATHILALHVCLNILNWILTSPWSPPRGRSALWARSRVSGKGKTRRSVSKEKATPRLSPPNPVSALRKTSPGEHRLHT